MKKPLFFFALLIPVCFAFTAPQNNRTGGGCPPPANVALTAQFGGAASFDWDDCGCDSEYRVYFVRNGQAGPEFSTWNSAITITGLPAGTYQFCFYTVCGGETSAIIVEEVVML